MQWSALWHKFDVGTKVILTSRKDYIVVESRGRRFAMRWMDDRWEEVDPKYDIIADCHCDFCNAIRASL